MEGIVLWGSNNIFHVAPVDRNGASGRIPSDGTLPVVDGLPQGIECRLKGKQLAGTGKGYNALAPGDRVQGDLEGGMIEERLPRRNEFVRWNRKRNAVQTIAANLDLLLTVASPSEPPFRPRFIDRVSVAAELANIPFGVIVNKRDHGVPPEVSRRIELFRGLGYHALETSATEDYGLDILAEQIRGLQVAFVGQSGAGKSTLLNAIAPGTGARVGEVSRKYNRGRHTTTLAVRIPLQELEGAIIDTPGIREIDLYAFPREQIAWGFPEMEPFIPHCRIPGCTHRHEPDCAVFGALELGEIDPDRYESYKRIMADHEMSQKLAGEYRYGAGR